MTTQMEQFNANLNERLEVKDRWISDNFNSVNRRLDDLARAQQKSAEDSQAFLQVRIEQVEQILKQLSEANERHRALIVEAHTDVHRINDRNLQEFKDTVSKSLGVITNSIDILREERGLFVLREAHDTQIDALEKLIDGLERGTNERIEVATKQLNERIETSTKQVREGLEPKVQGNIDRTAKIEQNIQVMNARNQQSIIALGILLTLVEIVIRFYQ
jgi:thymidylate synthase